jgi:hypothetical protein
MLSGQFTEREIEILLAALGFWRGQARPLARKTDPVLQSDEIDLLLSKLRGSLTTDQHAPLVSSTHGDPY